MHGLDSAEVSLKKRKEMSDKTPEFVDRVFQLRYGGADPTEIQ
jgi:hypothetical protein